MYFAKQLCFASLNLRVRQIGLRLMILTLLLGGADHAWAQRDHPISIGVPAYPQTAFPAEATRVHVVLLADTRSGDIGAPCAKDIAAFRKALTLGFGSKSGHLVFHDLTGTRPSASRDWRPGEIYLYLSELAVEDNDTLVIFHSGHGSIRSRHFPEPTHFLGINSGMISLGAIYDSLRGRHVRSLIVLTDTCSNIVNGGVLSSAFADEGSPGEVNPESVLNLFLRPVGEISITAAEDGTTAKASFRGANPGDAGSAFTVALLRLLHDKSRTFRSWSELFPCLREETYQASDQGHRARAFVLSERGLVAQPAVPQPADAPFRAPSSKPDAPGKPNWPWDKPTVPGDKVSAPASRGLAPYERPSRIEP